MSRDGKLLYAALNLGNQLAEIDVHTGMVKRTWDVGVAPHNVIITGEKAYVSCRGGRHLALAMQGSAGRGTLVGVDPVR